MKKIVTRRITPMGGCVEVAIVDTNRTDDEEKESVENIEFLAVRIDRRHEAPGRTQRRSR